MALSDWAGALQGIDHGLNNYLKIRQIQNQENRDRIAEQRAQQAEERALRMETRQGEIDTRTLTDWKRKDAEWKLQNEPRIDANTVIAKYPYLSDEGRTKLQQAAAMVGVDFSPEKKYSLNDINRFYDLLSKDKDLKANIYDDQRKTLQKNIAALKTELTDAEKTVKEGGLDAYSQFAQKQGKLKEMQDTLDTINAGDERYAKAEELKRATKKDEREEKKEERAEAREKRLETQAGAHLAFEKQKLEESSGIRLDEHRWKLILGMSPKRKETVSDPVDGTTSIREVPDIAEGMKMARRMRPDLFKDVPSETVTTPLTPEEVEAQRRGFVKRNGKWVKPAGGASATW